MKPGQTVNLGMPNSEREQPAGKVGFDRDVIVLGGAFSGASTALLLKRRRPELRITILERAVAFDRKVGESTTEISSCFMVRQLGMGRHLAHEQLPKQGLRFWFDRVGDESYAACGEIGPKFQVRLPAYQLDRARSDAYLLEEAEAAGCEVLRPAKLTEFTHGPEGVAVTFEQGGARQTFRARWLIDASGRASVTARKLGHWRSLADRHPTSAIWARFRGMRDIEGAEMRGDHPEVANACGASRALATNHLVGYGWWCWVIPLRGGDFSVGLVYDQRLFDPGQLAGANLGEKLKAHLLRHPVGREWFAKAEVVPGDVKAFSNLPYACQRIAEPGVLMVGDAAGFMDPLYSSGLDFAAFTISQAVEVVLAHPLPVTATADLERLNIGFAHAFEQWFEAIYVDKYFYLGDADLMSAAMLMDVGAFFIGPVRFLYRDSHQGFLVFPYSGPIGGAFAAFMKTYNRRLAVIARKRHAAGCYGKANLHRREMYPGFSPGLDALPLFLRGLGKWLRVECSAWRLPAPKAAERGVTGKEAFAPGTGGL